jgi:hypothetical protein
VKSCPGFVKADKRLQDRIELFDLRKIGFDDIDRGHLTPIHQINGFRRG